MKAEFISRLWRTRYKTGLLAGLLVACQQSPQELTEQRFMMGTLVSFTIAGSQQEAALQAIDTAVREMQRVADLFTIYGQAMNPVKALNQAPVGEVVALGEEVDAVLGDALQIREASGGAFEPALGALNLMWGFSADTQPDMPPAAAEVAALLPEASSAHLHHEARGWYRDNARTKLDFGGIAKGYAIDRGIAVLQQAGVRHAMINAGGDLRVLGDHLGKPWRIGIRDPRGDGVLGWLAIGRDAAIVTSGDYERFFVYKGQRYHHILDPQTGYPAAQSRSVTVLASSATLADAWSTALFVTGPEQGQRLLKSQPELGALWVDPQGNIASTPALAKLFHPGRP